MPTLGALPRIAIPDMVVFNCRLGDSELGVVCVLWVVVGFSDERLRLRSSDAGKVSLTRLEIWDSILSCGHVSGPAISIPGMGIRESTGSTVAMRHILLRNLNEDKMT